MSKNAVNQKMFVTWISSVGIKWSVSSKASCFSCGFNIVTIHLMTHQNPLQRQITFSMEPLQLFQWYSHTILWVCVLQQSWNQLVTYLVKFKIPYNHMQCVLFIFHSTDREWTVWSLSSCISYRIHTMSSRSATVWAYSSLGTSSTCRMPIWRTWSKSTITVFDTHYQSGYDFQQADTLHLKKPDSLPSGPV